MNLSGDIMRQRAVLMIELFQLKMQLAVKLVGSRDDKFVHQIVKPIRLQHEPGSAQFFAQRVDHRRELLRPS